MSTPIKFTRLSDIPDPNATPIPQFDTIDDVFKAVTPFMRHQMHECLQDALTHAREFRQKSVTQSNTLTRMFEREETAIKALGRALYPYVQDDEDAGRPMYPIAEYHEAQAKKGGAHRG